MKCSRACYNRTRRGRPELRRKSAACCGGTRRRGFTTGTQPQVSSLLGDNDQTDKKAHSRTTNNDNVNAKTKLSEVVQIEEQAGTKKLRDKCVVGRVFGRVLSVDAR